MLFKDRDMAEVENMCFEVCSCVIYLLNVFLELCTLKQGMKVRLKTLDETLHRLSSVRLDFADVCSESSALALRQAITLSSDWLQMLHQENDERLMKVVRGEKQGCSFPEAVDQQMALVSPAVTS